MFLYGLSDEKNFTTSKHLTRYLLNNRACYLLIKYTKNPREMRVKTPKLAILAHPRIRAEIIQKIKLIYI